MHSAAKKIALSKVNSSERNALDRQKLRKFMMAKQISLFNHKGGVSKTTTTFNLGWMLANKGQRVLLVDCDPQCNLTGMFLGFKGIEDLEKFYTAGRLHNIRDGLAPAFKSKPIPLKAVKCESIVGNDNLFLLPGHIGLAEYETTLGIAQELSGSLPTLQNLPGAMSRLFALTAKKYKIDIILVDMSPSLGPINQNLVSTSDYFLVPMTPDYFSVMAVGSLSNILPRWKEWALRAKATRVLQFHVSLAKLRSEVPWNYCSTISTSRA